MNCPQMKVMPNKKYMIEKGGCLQYCVKFGLKWVSSFIEYQLSVFIIWRDLYFFSENQLRSDTELPSVTMNGPWTTVCHEERTPNYRLSRWMASDLPCVTMNRPWTTVCQDERTPNYRLSGWTEPELPSVTMNMMRHRTLRDYLALSLTWLQIKLVHAIHRWKYR